MRNFIITLIVLTTLCYLNPAWANSAGVKITVPEEVGADENFTINLEISHSNNNNGHYVEWVRLWFGNELVKEWTYTSDNFVPDTKWTLGYDTSIEEKTEIKAKANCNLHGGSQFKSIVRIIGQEEDGGSPLLYPTLLVIIVVLVIGMGFFFKRMR